MVKAVGNVAVLEVLEGDEVGPDDAGVLKRAGLSPPEGLAGGESEGEGELGLSEVEWDPFGGFEEGFGSFGG